MQFSNRALTGAGKTEELYHKDHSGSLSPGRTLWKDQGDIDEKAAHSLTAHAGPGRVDCGTKNRFGGRFTMQPSGRKRL